MTNQSPLKRVLIISYYWPPSGGAGVQRWLKFVKYLPQFGWEPVVLTVDPAKASYPQKDDSLLHDVSPNTLIVRTSSFELYSLYRKLSGKGEIPYGGFANEASPGFFQKVSRFIRGNFFIPDPRKGWNRFALKEARELIRKLNIKHVITTGTPHSTHLIGLKLKHEFDIKWMADFRDPWIDAYYYSMFYQSLPAKWIDRSLENKVLKSCDVISTVSRGLQDIFESKAAGSYKGKIKILTNGFDPADFKGLVKEPTSSFTVVYTGTMTPSYRIYGFLEAIFAIHKAGIDIKVSLYGKVSEEILMEVRENDLQDVVVFNGYLPHSEIISAYQKADMLLLIVPDFTRNEGIVTGKIFEYLAVGSPILVIGPEGCEAARIVAETQSGRSAGYDDSDGMKAILMKYINNKDTSVTFKSSELIQQYSRVSLASKLAGILNEMQK